MLKNLNEVLSLSDNGLVAHNNIIVRYERVENDRNGNPTFKISLYDENGDSIYLELLKAKKDFKIRILKDNSFKVTTYQLKDTLLNCLKEMGI